MTSSDMNFKKGVLYLVYCRAKMKHNLNPIMNAQLDRNRRTRTHRRNLSDPRFSTSLTDSINDEEVSCKVWQKIMCHTWTEAKSNPTYVYFLHSKMILQMPTKRANENQSKI